MKICTGVELRNIIMDVTFIFENFQEFFFMSLGVKIRRFPMTLHVGLITVQRYRAACDTVIQYHS